MKGPNAAITPGGVIGESGEPTWSCSYAEHNRARGELTPKPISPQPRPAMLL